MKKRLITAFILIAIVIVALFMRNIDKVYFSVFLNIVIILATWEICYALKDRIHRFNKLVLILFAASTYTIFYFTTFANLVYFSIMVFMLCAIISMFWGKLEEISLVCLVIFYPILIMSLSYIINDYPEYLYFVLMMLSIAVATDTMAFFVGITVKGKKLCPRLSPKKTISGAIGGLFGGVLAVLIINLVYNPLDYSFFLTIPAGLIGAAFSELGDLFESFIKRQINVKDMSNMLPGHGGILDRIDAILFNMLFMYIYFFVFVDIFLKIPLT